MLEADFDLTFSRSRLTKSQRLSQRRYTLRDIDSNGINFVAQEDDRPSETPSSPTNTTLPDALKTDGIVTFDQFEKSYWPHLDQGLTKRLGKIRQLSFHPHVDFWDRSCPRLE